MSKQDTDEDPKTCQIDENLRLVYNEVAEESLPDRFTDLLNQLKQQDQDNGSDSSK